MLADVLAELDAQLQAMRVPHEGLRDFARLNLQPDTLQEVQQTLARWDHRVLLLSSAKAALEAVVGDGAIPFDPQPVSAAVLADLQDNAKTIAAAMATFGPIAGASELRVTAGEPLPK